MKRFNRKAMNPVVASIILIAIITAASIAVLAWMATLLLTGNENIEIENISFGPNGLNSWLSVTMNNSGQNSVTIANIWINETIMTKTDPIMPFLIDAGSSNTLKIMVAVISGATYTLKLESTKSNYFVNTTICS
jgi:hypothetical protein